MSALGWALAGAGALWIIGFVVACIVDRDTAAIVAGFFVAVLVAPVLASAELIHRLGWAGAVPLDGRALEQFARMKRKGGGRAVALFYTRRLGVIFVRGLRENEPDPVRPIRVLSPEEREARRRAAEDVEDHG